MRVEGWETAFVAAVQEGLQRPFEWGQHDCATFAFAVRAVLTGRDDTGLWRGQYRSAAGARRVMRSLGWADFAAAGRALLGEPLPTPLLAQRGDLAIAGDDMGAWIVTGREIVSIGPGGPVVRPLRDATLAWRV